MRIGAQQSVVSHVKRAWIMALALICLCQAPALAAGSHVSRTLAGVVRIQVTLTPREGDPVDVYGSGWTRSCIPGRWGYTVVAATAGHVIDVDALERSLFSGQHTAVKVVVFYRDGRQFVADRENLRVDRIHDYGEIRFRTPLLRSVLPVGDPSAVALGDALHTVASPGAVRFGLFTGTLTLREPIPVPHAPRGAWLCSMHVGPGASGAPVLDVCGRVVATFVGFVMWRFGGVSSVIVPLPASSKRGFSR